MAEFESVSRFRKELRSNNLFRLSVIVFIAHIIVFFFVELRSLKSSSFMAAFISTIMLASMILLMGILTVQPLCRQNADSFIGIDIPDKSYRAAGGQIRHFQHD